MAVPFSIDMGNIWECLSAVGTIAASSIALWLAWDERRRKVSATLLWFINEDFRAKILVQNMSRKSVVIVRAFLAYDGVSYGPIPLSEEVEYRNCCVIQPGKIQELPLKMPQELNEKLQQEEKENTNGIHFKPAYQRERIQTHRFQIRLYDINGKVYKSSQKYSKEELLMLYVGEAIFEK